jgi:hypothetical protein
MASTNDNNNFGSLNMGAEDWKPSSRVLGNGTGGASTISFGDYVPSPQSKPTRDSSRPRIIGGKVVLPQSDKDSAAAAYNAQFSAPVSVVAASQAEPAQPRYTSHSSSGNILSHVPSPAPKAANTTHHSAPHEHAKIERNYVGNDVMLERLRETDFESKAQHDGNELRAEVRVDYNETHLADAAAHKQPLAESCIANAKESHAVAAVAKPEMRGCEGYKPNMAAWEHGGLQSSSTELKGPQAVARSSTRLHAPPGGASSIVFG